jgi:hypothetical protein
MDEQFEIAKKAMRANLETWGFYDSDKVLGGTIFGVPLHEFMFNAEDSRLLVSYLQYMLYKELKKND